MYYVYDCNKEEFYTATIAELHRFVNNEGTVFGNSPNQKRNLKKKVFFYDMWITENMGQRLIKYIAYDEFYNLIDYKVLEDWAFNYHCKEYKQFSHNRNRGHEFRNGPVPYRGAYRYSFYNYHRRPRTKNELVANSDPEYKEYARTKRKDIPTSCDDIRRADRYDKRSWKKCKKRKQWM